MEYQNAFFPRFYPIRSFIHADFPVFLYSRYIFNKNLFACCLYILLFVCCLLFTLFFTVFLGIFACWYILYIYIKRSLGLGKTGKTMGTGFTLGKSRKTRKNWEKPCGMGFFVGFISNRGSIPNNILTKNLLGPTPETLDQRQ